MGSPTKRIPPRVLTTLHSVAVTPYLQRVTFKGFTDDLPINRHGAHIKVFIPKAHQNGLHMPRLSGEGTIVWPPIDLKPWVRTYTLRSLDKEKNTLVIEFTRHHHGGPAAEWAMKAQAGDTIGFAGPGGPDPIIRTSGFYLIAGDLSAIPAIQAILETLPQHAQGKVFLEVPNKAAVFALNHPPGIAIEWLFLHETSPRHSTQLLDAIKTLDLSSEQKLTPWIAGENSSVISIRHYLMQAYRLKKHDFYAVPYWKDGQNEERYHEERHRLMDEK